MSGQILGACHLMNCPRISPPFLVPADNVPARLFNSSQLPISGCQSAPSPPSLSTNSGTWACTKWQCAVGVIWFMTMCCLARYRAAALHGELFTKFKGLATCWCQWAVDLVQPIQRIIQASLIPSTGLSPPHVLYVVENMKSPICAWYCIVNGLLVVSSLTFMCSTMLVA